MVTCTGLAAITLILATLPQGARVLAPHDCYGGTYRLLAALQAQGKLAVDFVDQSDAARARGRARRRAEAGLDRDAEQSAAADRGHPRGGRGGARARRAGGRRTTRFSRRSGSSRCRSARTSSMHSTTKYLNGHSDVVGGAVVAATPELAESLAWWANVIGVTGAPFDSFLSLRGVRTLHARMRAARGEHRRRGRIAATITPAVRAGVLSRPRRSSGPRRSLGASSRASAPC